LRCKLWWQENPLPIAYWTLYPLVI
jgi:hypothetical protein